MFHFYTPGSRQKTFGLLNVLRGYRKETLAWDLLPNMFLLVVLTKSPAGKLSLDDICALKNDNRVIDCANINFIGKKAGVKVTVDTCIHPTKVTLEMIVKALGKWKYIVQPRQGK